MSDRSDTPAAGGSETQERASLSLSPLMLRVSLAALRSCPTNPRKVFKDLDRLAANLREIGQIEPIVVRQVTLPGNEALECEAWEVVVGERRFRAAQLGGLLSILAIVRELDDKQVLELQIAENNQRADVHPLEEADAFTRLYGLHGEAVAEIAARVGRSERYVRDRMRLSSLVDPAKEAFLAGKFGSQETRVAFLLSRIPQRLQPDALRAVLGMAVDGDVTASRVQTYLLGQYTLRLESAPFDPRDPKLTAAGACTTCPKRAGNQPELFPEVAAKETCTDPLCFAEKRKADYSAKEQESQARGRPVISPKQSAQLFDGCKLKLDAPFVDLDDQDFEDHEDPKKCRTWRQIFGKRVPATVLAQDAYGAAHDVLPRAELLESLRTAGAKDAAKRLENVDAAKAPRNKDGLDNAAAERQKQEATATRDAVDAALGDCVADCDKRAPGDAEVWLFVLHCTLESTWDETAKDVAVRRTLVEPKSKKSLAKDALTEDSVGWSSRDIRSLVVELLAARSAYSQGLKSTPFARACQGFGVDFKAHLKEARKSQKAERQEKKTAKSRTVGRVARVVSDRSDTTSGDVDAEPGPPCRVCGQRDCELLGLPEEKRRICVTCDGLEAQVEDAVLYLGQCTLVALAEHFSEGGGAVGEYSEERTTRAVGDLRAQGRLYEDEKGLLRAKKRRVKPQKFRRSAKVR